MHVPSLGSEGQGAPEVEDPAGIEAQVGERETERAQQTDLDALEARLYGAMTTSMAAMAAQMQAQMQAMMMAARTATAIQQHKIRLDR